jgi:uncharacterized membrane protein YjdF
MTLSQVLRSNATTSLLSGIALAAMPTYFSQLFEVENTLVFRILGFVLLFFAATVFYASIAPEEKPRQVTWIIIQDLLWVVGSIVILTFRLFSLSAIGYGLIAIMAVIVAIFGYLQYKR